MEAAIWIHTRRERLQVKFFNRAGNLDSSLHDHIHAISGSKIWFLPAREKCQDPEGGCEGFGDNT